jgi:hypothetical protein
MIMHGMVNRTDLEQPLGMSAPTRQPTYVVWSLYSQEKRMRTRDRPLQPQSYHLSSPTIRDHNVALWDFGGCVGFVSEG